MTSSFKFSPKRLPEGRSDNICRSWTFFLNYTSLNLIVLLSLSKLLLRKHIEKRTLKSYLLFQCFVDEVVTFTVTYFGKKGTRFVNSFFTPKTDHLYLVSNLANLQNHFSGLYMTGINSKQSTIFYILCYTRKDIGSWKIKHNLYLFLNFLSLKFLLL